MKIELIRWRRFVEESKVDGWVTKDQLNFSNNYKEIVSCGMLISETDNYVVLASSREDDKYDGVQQIFKSNIIKRGSVNVEFLEDTKNPGITKIVETTKLDKKMEKWKNLETEINSGEEEMNPTTQKVQNNIDWVKKCGVTEDELREVLQAFPTRKEAAAYLGVDSRHVSFAAIQIGERKRPYQKHSKRKTKIGDILNKIGVSKFLKDYYTLCNESLQDKYNISKSGLQKILNTIKEQGHTITRKRVCSKSEPKVEAKIVSNPIQKKQSVYINPSQKWYTSGVK